MIKLLLCCVCCFHPCKNSCFLQYVLALGAENIGNTDDNNNNNNNNNNNHHNNNNNNNNNNTKKHDFQTMGWRSEVIVWKSWFFGVIGFPLLFVSSFAKTLVFFSNVFLCSALQKHCFVLFPHLQKHFFVFRIFFSPRGRKHWRHPKTNMISKL